MSFRTTALGLTIPPSLLQRADQVLVRLDHGVLIALGCGERDEAASQAERAGCHAHRYGKGAAGRDQGRVTTDADLAGYTEGTGCLPPHPAIARRG